MSNVTLEQWRMLIAVVDAGGFAQAASVIGKSQSAINHAVHRLQDQLEIRVLEQDGRKIRLTEEGRILLERGRLLVGAAAQIDQLADSLAAGAEVQLSLVDDQAYAMSDVAAVLELFSQRFPDLRVQVHEAVLNGARELVEDETPDLIITGHSLANQMVGQTLQEQAFIAVAAPRHPLVTAEQELTLDELVNYRQLVVRDSARKYSSEDGWLKAQARWTVSHVASSLALALQGCGYAWFPESLITPYLDSGQLIRLRLKEGAIRKMEIKLYTGVNVHEGSAAAQLAELFLAHHHAH